MGITRLVVVLAGLATSTCGAGFFQPAAQIENELSPGTVKFLQLASSAFDPHTRDPAPAEQAWMREHYYRMKVWSTYFDSRLAWFPNAWFHKNSYAIYPNSTTMKMHPEWILRDSDGNMLYIPYACRQGECPQFAGDFGNPAFRTSWIEAAVETASRGYVGIWIDDVNLSWRVSDGQGRTVIPQDPRTGDQMTIDDYQRYFAEFMAQIRAALPDIAIAHNSLWFADSPSFDNPYVARQIDSADFVNLERGATDKGLTGGTGRYGFETFLQFIDYVHSRDRHVILMDEAETPDEREFALASWFLISNGGDIVSTENLSWSSPDNWWDGYELELGDSVGPRYAWNGLLRRDFTCGLVLVNPPEQPTRSATLLRDYRDLNDIAVKSLSVRNRSAVILRQRCNTE